MSNVTIADLMADRHARRYGDVLANVQRAVDALLRRMNERGIEDRLMDSERHHGRPALAGVVRDIESDPDIRIVLARGGRTALRFRQLCGVVVKLKMSTIGWTTTGTKGSLSAISDYFTLAERFREPTSMPRGAISQRTA